MRLINGRLPFCTACYARLAVPCAWCCQPIFLGDPVTLYTRVATYTPPAEAICYDGQQFVGCLRAGCAMTAADRSGFWLPDPVTGMGRVERVASPLEILARLLQSGSTHLFIVGDISEIPPELLPPQPDEN
jgi:hypothetical protein